MPLPIGSTHGSSGGLMQLLSQDLDQNGQDEQQRDGALRNIYQGLQSNACPFDIPTKQRVASLFHLRSHARRSTPSSIGRCLMAGSELCQS
jgi:hypothetical protein